MTRHTSEENLLKCSNVLAETKPFENIVNPIDNNSLMLYDLSKQTGLNKEIEQNQLNSDISGITKKSMIKLYNLENNEFKRTNIKINLDIDLYQMEDY